MCFFWFLLGLFCFLVVGGVGGFIIILQLAPLPLPRSRHNDASCGDWILDTRHTGARGATRELVKNRNSNSKLQRGWLQPPDRVTLRNDLRLNNMLHVASMSLLLWLQKIVKFFFNFLLPRHPSTLASVARGNDNEFLAPPGNNSKKMVKRKKKSRRQQAQIKGFGCPAKFSRGLDPGQRNRCPQIIFNYRLPYRDSTKSIMANNLPGKNPVPVVPKQNRRCSRKDTPMKILCNYAIKSQQCVT